jgi:hypothetical protein
VALLIAAAAGLVWVVLDAALVLPEAARWAGLALGVWVLGLTLITRWRGRSGEAGNRWVDAARDPLTTALTARAESRETTAQPAESGGGPRPTRRWRGPAAAGWWGLCTLCAAAVALQPQVISRSVPRVLAPWLDVSPVSLTRLELREAEADRSAGDPPQLEVLASGLMPTGLRLVGDEVHAASPWVAVGPGQWSLEVARPAEPARVRVVAVEGRARSNWLSLRPEDQTTSAPTSREDAPEPHDPADSSQAVAPDAPSPDSTAPERPAFAIPDGPWRAALAAALQMLELAARDVQRAAAASQDARGLSAEARAEQDLRDSIEAFNAAAQTLENHLLTLQTDAEAGDLRDLLSALQSLPLRQMPSGPSTQAPIDPGPTAQAAADATQQLAALAARVANQATGNDGPGGGAPDGQTAEAGETPTPDRPLPLADPPTDTTTQGIDPVARRSAALQRTPPAYRDWVAAYFDALASDGTAPPDAPPDVPLAAPPDLPRDAPPSDPPTGASP